MRVSVPLMFVALLAAVVASGVQVAYLAQEVRRLHAELEAAQKLQDAELAEHSRLLLERSTLTAYQSVERIAKRDLAMDFPERVERVEP